MASTRAAAGGDEDLALGPAVSAGGRARPAAVSRRRYLTTRAGGRSAQIGGFSPAFRNGIGSGSPTTGSPLLGSP